MPRILTPALFVCTLAFGLLAQRPAACEPSGAQPAERAPAAEGAPTPQAEPPAKAPAPPADPNRPGRTAEPGFARQAPGDPVGNPGEIRGGVRVERHKAGDKNQPGTRPNTGITIRR